jgi:pimeloyl-ACP methyl ester carboxylesterase
MKHATRRPRNRHMVRPALACCLALACVTPQAGAQTQQDSLSPAARDSEYRKFDDVLTFLRARTTAQYAIRSPKGIDEGAYVPIGGIDQWITIRGQDRDNPVLLILHGGPGDVTNSWTFAMFAPWEERFTVVQWDQRGAGRTLGRSGAQTGPTMTIDRMAQDGIELADYLRRHLNKSKIIVVAHSFGSIIGLKMVRARPDLFYAYVGTGQVADETKNYYAAYDALVKKARAIGNQLALAELTRVGPPPYKSGDGYRVQWKWANRFEGADQFLYERLGLALVAPGSSVRDINMSNDGQRLSGERLVSQATSQTSADLGLDFAIPVFFFQGAEDFTAPTVLAHQYLDALKAPQKAFVPIDGGGHFVMFMKPDQFLKELVTRVRPLAVAPSAN